MNQLTIINTLIFRAIHQWPSCGITFTTSTITKNQVSQKSIGHWMNEDFDGNNVKLFDRLFSGEHLNLPLLRCIMPLKIDGKIMKLCEKIFPYFTKNLWNASENKWEKFWFRELCSRLVNDCSKHGIFFLVHLVVHFACWMWSFCGTGPGVYKPDFFKDFLTH